MKSKSAKPRLSKGAAKDHILNVASDLFYNNGIRAVGVDTIVAEAGVAKTTIYDHFASKDDLITAYLERNDAIFLGMLDEAEQQHPDNPRQQLMDVFQTMEGLILAPQFIGCPFISAASEFPELDQPGHQVALAHKQKVRARLQSLAQAAGAKDYEQLGDQLLLLLDGAFASKRVFRSAESPLIQLMPTVKLLLDAHLGTST
jgi:AcrR family transcriptional regulator